MTFHESGLVFNFPEDWKVIKWDEHRFYGYVSGRGFKGVDFMVLLDDGLHLMEVKNYRDRRPQDGQHPFDLVMADPDFYAAIFLQKFADSFALIEIIEKYYLRKQFFNWWSRRNYWGLKTLAHLPFFQKSDLIFWTRAAQIIREQPENVQLDLWLEPGPKISLENFMELKKKLLSYFKKNLILPEGVTIAIHNAMNQSLRIKVEVDAM